jgi:hypothetical protein
MRNILTPIFAYIIIVILLCLNKPDFLYDKEKQKYREFGFNDKQNETLIPIHVLCVIIAVLLFIIVNKKS